MKVNKQLIEKYHRQECTAEEAEAVEAWLFTDNSDELPDLPANENAEKHKQAMWADIESILPPKNEPVNTSVKVIGYNNNKLWMGIAASIVIAVGIVFAGKISSTPTEEVSALVEVDNSSAMQVQHVNNHEYHLSVGPGTSARINNRDGIVNFSGSMVIRPQKDIEFSFGKGQKETFRSGETYILLDDRNGSGRVIIVNEKNLTDMPPVLQKKISTEFNI